MIRDNLIQSNIKNEDLRDLRPVGALVYGTVETPGGKETSVTVFVDSAPDLSLYTPSKSQVNTTVTPFLIDVDFPSKGISKFGVNFNEEGNPQQVYFHNRFLFSLKSNDVIVINTNTTVSFTTNNMVYIMVSNAVIKNEAKTITVTNLSTSVATNTKTEVITNTFVGSTEKRIYYFGRLVVTLDPTAIEDDDYRLRYTNTFDYDKEMFKREYPICSNSQFIPLDVTVEK